MTIQLELNFLPSYAFSSAEDLYLIALACSTVTNKSRYLPIYRALQRQASDLKNYAFFYGYIDCDEYAYLSKSIIESSDIYWS